MSTEEPTGPEKFRFKPTEYERLNPAVSPVPEPEAADARPAPLAPIPSVHDILRQNVEHDRRAGWYDVVAGRDRKQLIRVRGFIIAVLLVDVPLGWIAWACGHTDPIPFVASLGAMAMFTGRLIWETWFLRTD